MKLLCLYSCLLIFRERITWLFTFRVKLSLIFSSQLLSFIIFCKYCIYSSVIKKPLSLFKALAFSLQKQIGNMGDWRRRAVSCFWPSCPSSYSYCSSLSSFSSWNSGKHMWYGRKVSGQRAWQRLQGAEATGQPKGKFCQLKLFHSMRYHLSSAPFNAIPSVWAGCEFPGITVKECMTKRN